MKAERWLPVVGFEGFYEVSSLGRVRSVTRWQNTKGNVKWKRRGKIMRVSLSPPMGYPRLCLSRGKKTRVMVLVHTLVLEAFVGPRPAGMVARHYPDRTPTNVSAENLSWASYSTNAKDRAAHGTMQDNRGEKHPNAKLSNAKVRRIRALARRGLRQRDIASAVGCCQSNVCFVLQGTTWGHVQ